MTAANLLQQNARVEPVNPIPVPADADYVVTSAANTAGVITLDADAERPIVLTQVAWSYSAAPTGGRITVEDEAGTVVWDTYVTAGGYQSHTFTPPIHGRPNKEMVITAAAGGGSLTSKLSVNAYKLF